MRAISLLVYALFLLLNSWNGAQADQSMLHFILEYEQLRQDYAALSNRTAQVRADNSRLTDRLLHMSEIITTLLEENRMLKATIVTLEQNVTQFKLENKKNVELNAMQLGNKISKKQSVVREKEAAIETYKTDLVNSKLRIETLQQGELILREQLQSTRNSCDILLKESQLQHEASLLRLETAIRERDIEIGNYKAELVNVKQKSAELAEQHEHEEKMIANKKKFINLS